MSEQRYRVLFVASHPVQYAAPIFRMMAQHPQLEILVVYCSLQGAQSSVDPEFGIPIAWDIPLLDGYPWISLRNHSWNPGLGRFWGLFNPGLWRLIGEGHFDAVVLFTGYSCASFWIACAAAKRNGIAFLFGTDAHELRPLDGRRWKVPIKRALWPLLFRLADVVIVPSSGSVHLMRSLGLPADRIVLTPYVVDNEWWAQRAAQSDRTAVRARWKIPANAPVVLFCAKLQPWKRPLDLLRALARAGLADAYLVYAGEGPLRSRLEQEAERLGLAKRVRLLGFVNQSALPETYRAADLMVLPSEYEAFAVVVNEAMLCGCPVIVSDRVGARYDLVRDGETGFVFPCGNVEALAKAIRGALEDPLRLARMREGARQQMTAWSPRENIQTTLHAIQIAVSYKSGAGRR